MNDDYLWDGSGEPDPEIVRLEKTLAPLRYRSKPRRWPLYACAGAIAAALAIFALLPSRVSVWKVDDRAARLGETLDVSRETVMQSAIGSLRIEPGSRLKLSSDNRLALERGVLHALIWAPPRQFVVDMPGTAAIDLGCRYTLRVEPDASGLLTVDTGWVAFQSGDLEAFIPAGAACRTHPRRGAGTPFRVDAAESLRTAVAAFDSGGRSSLGRILADARAEDGLTLWHLLARTEARERAQVYDRFRQLVDVPDLRAAILRGDPRAMDAAWNALGLGETRWWRGWKRNL